MCVNSRYIYNPYSRKSVLVKCGKCECCQQEKAVLRSNRIRNNVMQGTLTLFITLTYTNDYVPYVKRSELMGDSFDINVYRNADFRYTFSRFSGLKKKKVDGVSIVDKVFMPCETRSYSSLRNLQSLKKSDGDNVGVCYYPDFQKFMKRLRQIILRKYHVTKKFNYFVCSEYGSRTKRPHFHALLFIPSDCEKEFRQAVLEAWAYADCSRTERYIEIARDAASYVSSYVNGSADLPACFKGHFDQKHHYSENFGCGLDCFKLSSLLAQIERGTLYYYSRKQFDGASCVNDVSIPAYVINRFFPKFKGFGWCTSSSLFNIARKPENVCSELSKIENPLYDYNSKETYSIYVRLFNARECFKRETGLNDYDFAHYYVRAWRLYSSQHLKDCHKDITLLSDYTDFYDNANDLNCGVVSAPTIPQKVFEKMVLNPNERSDVIKRNVDMTTLFHKMSKQKRVTNFVMSENGHNV